MFSSATFTFSSTEAGSTFACELDGASVPCTSPKTYTGLSDGEHTFTVAATDPAGNEDTTPDNRTWTVGGGTNPQTDITSGPSGHVLSRDATFEFTSSAAGATFECALDGVAFAACSSPTSYSGLTTGDSVEVTVPSVVSRAWSRIMTRFSASSVRDAANS